MQTGNSSNDAILPVGYWIGAVFFPRDCLVDLLMAHKKQTHLHQYFQPSNHQPTNHFHFAKNG